MARIRMIKPEFFDDPQIAELSPFARLFFIGLWMQADRAGRLVDDVKRLKARIFPFDDVDVEALAVELHGKDMVRRYLDSEGHGYMWIRSFTKHQRPHPKEPTSVIQEWTPGAVKRNGEPCKNTEGSPLESNGTRNLDPLESNGKSLTVEAIPASASFLSFPVIGPGPSNWSLTEAQCAEWASLFPGHDIHGECRKALAWVRADSGRRKTCRGMAKFLVSWVTRSVERNPALAAVPAPSEHGQPWICPHETPCNRRSQCEQATILGRPVKVLASA